MHFGFYQNLLRHLDLYNIHRNKKQELVKDFRRNNKQKQNTSATQIICKTLKLKTALTAAAVVCSFQDNGLNIFLPCLFNENTSPFFFSPSDVDVGLIFHLSQRM